MNKFYKYQVVTSVSSLPAAPRDERGRHILFESNNFSTARRECRQWAAEDDIYVEVVQRMNNEVKSWFSVFSCDGYCEATERFPRTVKAC